MSSANPRPPGVQSGVHDDVVAERRTLRDYYIIVRERLWIAAPLALVAALALVFVKARETPLYQARATLQFEKPERVVIQQEVTEPGIASQADLETYVHVLGSTKLQRRVLDSMSADERSRLQRGVTAAAADGTASDTDLLGTVLVQPVRNSYLVGIHVTHPNAEASALVANRYVDQFILYLLHNVSGTNEVAVDFLQRRAEELRQEAEAAEQRLQDYQKRHNLLSLDNNTNIIQGRLLTVNSALQSARLDRIRTEELHNQVQSFLQADRNLLEIAAIAAHGTVPSLRAQLDNLRQSQAVLAERYFERHPKMIELANQITAAEDQLRQALELAVADLRTSLDKARSNEAALEREYATNEQDQLRLRDLAVEYRSLENQAAVAKNTYVQILDRLNQTTTSKSLENVPVRPLDRAVVPAKPFRPDLPSIIKNAIVVFGVVFLGVAIGLSFLDDRVKSAWDVESFIGTHLLGIIPNLGEVKDDEKHALVLKNNPAAATESFLSVYSSIKIQSKLDFPKSLLVTSTIPGEGKTLVSSNLAGSFARHGRSTLLIDCDLRRPMLHRHFNQENTRGLIPWFESGATFEDVMRDHPRLGITRVGENLSLLCSGGRSRTPTEILESPAFFQLLERLGKEFELVVIDSPPLGAVTDSLLIADRVDEVVYVCRFNRAYRKHIRQYVKQLKGGKSELLGVVLNGLSPRRIEYYSNYRYYRSYKKYYGAEA